MLKKRGKRVVVGGYAANHYPQKIGNRHSECNEESQKNNSNSLKNEQRIFPKLKKQKSQINCDFFIANLRKNRTFDGKKNNVLILIILLTPQIFLQL